MQAKAPKKGSPPNCIVFVIDCGPMKMEIPRMTMSPLSEVYLECGASWSLSEICVTHSLRVLAD
jgi:hypothetical protein